MKYVIIVMSSPYGGEKSRSAFLFSNNLLSLGHTIDIVFFYSHGVLNANSMIYVANDDCNILHEWEKLHQNFQVPLHICINSSLKRGLINHKQSVMLEYKRSHISSCFILSGFMELFHAIQKTDRVIQF
ncbi:Sulfurtransferase TusD [Buchnera aphidicola (Eriosoma lanigerum)]|uniref:sulfurtransferase complex subunit TusD n=1 Tax=Buchnera aphidicola TaxID=9 RepID=UPI00346390DD